MIIFLIADLCKYFSLL